MWDAKVCACDIPSDAKHLRDLARTYSGKEGGVPPGPREVKGVPALGEEVIVVGWHLGVASVEGGGWLIVGVSSDGVTVAAASTAAASIVT